MNSYHNYINNSNKKKIIFGLNIMWCIGIGINLNNMNKFRTLFLITAVIDLLAVLPLVLFSFNPDMMEEMVFSQFPGINDAGKEALEIIHFVFGVIGISMLVAVLVAVNIKVKESAQTAAKILSIIHLGWVLPDWFNFILGNAHPPIIFMLLSAASVLALVYAWKKGEV